MKVTCQICKKEFGSISYRHLALHNVSTVEYRSMFPGEVMFPYSKAKYEKISLSLTGRKQTIEHRLKNRLSHLGVKQNISVGALAERGRKISIALTGKKLSPERVEKIRQRMLGKQYHLGMKVNEEGRKNMSVAHKQLCKDSNYKQALIQRLVGAKSHPNKAEQTLTYFLDENFRGSWRYVGNGTLYVGEGNPDFVHQTNRWIIELFGCYFHACPKCKISSDYVNDEASRKAYFEECGYKTLVIWLHELKDRPRLLEKVRVFTSGGTSDA